MKKQRDQKVYILNLSEDGVTSVHSNIKSVYEAVKWHHENNQYPLTKTYAEVCRDLKTGICFIEGPNYDDGVVTIERFWMNHL